MTRAVFVSSRENSGNKKDTSVFQLELIENSASALLSKHTSSWDSIGAPHSASLKDLYRDTIKQTNAGMYVVIDI